VWKSITIGDLEHPTLTLTAPVVIAVEPDASGFQLSNDSLQVHAFGKTIEEALQEWQKKLAGLYLCYSDTADEEMTAAARKLKKRLITTVKERGCLSSD